MPPPPAPPSYSGTAEGKDPTRQVVWGISEDTWVSVLCHSSNLLFCVVAFGGIWVLAVRMFWVWVCS